MTDQLKTPEGYELDLFEAIPVPISFSISDNKDPTKRKQSFSKQVDLPDTMRNNAFFQGTFRMYALAGVILHAATESKDEKLASEDKPFIPSFLGYVEATIVLGSVVALFTAFVVIQIQYFFSGTTNIHVDGYTYGEYARRGFGEWSRWHSLPRSCC